MKEIIRRREGIDIGAVRKPLPDIIPEDNDKIEQCIQMINKAIGEL
jgi:N-acetylneuraminate lyase